MTFTGAVTSLFFERLKSKLSVSLLYALSFGTLGVGYLIVGVAGSIGWVGLGLLIGGVGIGLIMPTTNALVMKVTPLTYRGRAMGWISTFVYGGQFLAPLLAEPIIQSFSISTPFLSAGGLMFITATGFFVYSKRTMNN